MNKSTGRLIALYGVNNLGKSTQLTMLTTALAARGIDVVRRKSPNYETPSGKIISAILREGRPATNHELQLWQAVNMHQEQAPINHALTAGQTVITEDYWGTTIAWGLGGGVPRADLDAMIAGIHPPDVAILLHGKRFTHSTEKGHRHEENTELIDQVQDHHLDLAEEFGWHKVNANQTPEEVHAAIMAHIDQKVAV